MDSFNSEVPAAPTPVINIQRQPRIWKFWGTALWGLFVFAAMFVGQIAVVAWFVLRQEGPFDVAAAIQVLGGGLTISLSPFSRHFGSPYVNRVPPSRTIWRCAGPRGPIF